MKLMELFSESRMGKTDGSNYADTEEEKYPDMSYIHDCHETTTCQGFIYGLSGLILYFSIFR